MKYLASKVIMVRPRHFGFDESCASDNVFQQRPSMDAQMLLNEVHKAFDAMAFSIEHAGIAVDVLHDNRPMALPDAIFPNNWVAFMPGGQLVIFPMKAELRRQERHPVWINQWVKKATAGLIDLTPYEWEGKFLEGTGSLVFDHALRRAFLCVSPRSDKGLASDLCKRLGYELHVFHADDGQGSPYYHTNVMLSIGADCVVVCLEAIPIEPERKKLMEILSAGRKLLPISRLQVSAFAGNVLQLQSSRNQAVWVISSTAWNALEAKQRKQFETSGAVCICAVPLIEKIGGGSVRCMLAERFF